MKSTPFVKRPVSPIEAEPLIVAAEDILYPASDIEDSLESRKSKRRRIEAQAQRYLEGKPLFIQSASLRGPLDTGWVNPWTRKPRRKRGGILRIPDQTDIVDLTEANPPPILPQPATRQENAPENYLNPRPSVTSDVGQHATPALVSVARRAKSNEIGGQPRPRDGNDTMAGQLPAPTKDWLNSDIKFFDSDREREFKSPTPTPMARQRPRPETPVERTAPRTPITRDIRSSPAKVPQIFSVGFTPVDKPKPSAEGSLDHVMDIDGMPGHQLSTNQSPLVPADPQSSNGVGYREIVLDEADEETKLGFFSAKALAQKAAQNWQDEIGHSEARRLSQQAAFAASQSAVAPEVQKLETTLEPTSVAIFKPPPMKEAVSIEQSSSKARKLQHKDSPHAIPPSSNLAEFQYRIARKKAPILENAANPSPFAQALREAKAKAEAKKMKHLSFTSTGAIKSFRSRSTSRASSVETARSRPSHQDPSVSQEDTHRKSNLAQSTLSSQTDQEVHNAPSNVLLEGPEAQVVQPPAAPSGPSTDILETDKQPLNFASTEEGEGDSYMNLSTQAALSKAQQSFQDALLSPVQDFPKHRVLVNGSRSSPTAYKTPNGNLPVILRSSRPGISNEDPVLTPEEAPTTQAMMDAMSPFAMTTAKKKTPSPVKPMQHQKRASFAHSPLPSPSHTFGTTRRSLSMSTSSESPSPTPSRRSPKRGPVIKPPPILSKTSTGASKPLSTATSTAFSIAPNGTLTEVYQQDGQQQYQNGMGVDSSWDLDQALEEAGSFLETLDVDAEARKRRD
ncbi:MAG: hypothetical protein Q9195_005295 [Heterodermia aff. obscurata]